jgi:hypothetical protein
MSALLAPAWKRTAALGCLFPAWTDTPGRLLYILLTGS